MGTKKGKSFVSINGADKKWAFVPGGGVAFDTEDLLVFFSWSCLLVLYIFSATTRYVSEVHLTGRNRH